MQLLKLPSFDYKIKKVNGTDYIYDIIRNKFILLTPEEWVRQHVLNYLMNELCYPKGLIKVESGLVYNDQVKRSDIVVYNNMGLAHILVECKAPNVAINQSTMEQVAMYNRTLKASIIVLSNGLAHYTFQINPEGKLTNLSEIPTFKRN